MPNDVVKRAERWIEIVQGDDDLDAALPTKLVRDMKAEITRLRSGAYAAGVADAARVAYVFGEEERPTDQQVAALLIKERILALAFRLPPCQNAQGVCDQTPPCVGVCKTRVAALK